MSAACVLALALTGCTPDEPGQSRLAGLLFEPALNEISGMTASLRREDRLWVLNDGGSAATLHAIGLRGTLQGPVMIEGVEKVDWEDLAGFEWEGKPYLLIADTGDNGGIRKTLQLHIVPEPEHVGAGAQVRPAWSIEFRWPDGARDCEAVAVDAVRGEIILISKKRQPPQVFTLPLRPGGTGIETARLTGTLAGVPQPNARERSDRPGIARLRSQVTAASIAPQRDAIAVLTYDNLLIYQRRLNQSWAQALASQPFITPLGLLPQAEALAWSHRGNGLYASGEFTPAPLLYWPYQRARQNISETVK